MKKIIVAFLIITLWYASSAWSEITYKMTSIEIKFNLDGDMYTYPSETGSAFFGASTVIIDGQLYIHQKINYVKLGSVKQITERTYEWIPEGLVPQDLDFALVLDVENKKIERIRFDHPETLTVYTWKDLLTKENTEEANVILKMWK